MKKIFTVSQFPANEYGEYSPAGITPAEYLEKMYSDIEEGELYIAKDADEEGAVYVTAAALSDAAEVCHYVVDASKADAAEIARKEQKLFDAFTALAALCVEEKDVMTIVKSAVEAAANADGLRFADAVVRAQRIEKLLKLGAPEVIIAGERLCFAEELALNAIASSREVIEKKDFARLQDA